MDLLGVGTWSLTATLALLLGTAVLILIVGTAMTREADRLADRTGLGEAIFGAVLLGASTSLSGSVTSVVTAYQGFPGLAASNAIGGIAVQTTWLAVADITYRRANLEHAAASIENMLQGALLCVLLGIPLVVMSVPSFTFFAIHPATFVLFAAYLYGMRVTRAARRMPLWRPHQTSETREDEPHEDTSVSTTMLWVRFTVLVLIAGVAGYLVAVAGVGIVERTGLDESTVGGFITSVTTSLPELVVAIAAVRRGALTLAVGGIIGGNTFDVLFLAFSDIAYRGGSIYHVLSASTVFLIALAIVMTGALLMGLLRRERHGVGGIGFESALILVLYVGGLLLIVLT